ncbi:MAG TPA: HEAT repeat domain-containing protein [Mycobacteriales bacterium]|nr:HEAT repeat domain-containing protein [Mycobacteriales bacterium]
MEDAVRLLDSADKAHLLDAVSHPDPKVRHYACRLLDHHELDADVAHRMVMAMSDPNRKVRNAALHTLGCEGCKPAGAENFPVDVIGLQVRSLRSDASLRVRRSAASSLMFQNPMEARVRRAFHRVLRDETDPELRAKAARAVARRA